MNNSTATTYQLKLNLNKQFHNTSQKNQQAMRSPDPLHTIITEQLSSSSGLFARSTAAVVDPPSAVMCASVARTLFLCATGDGPIVPLPQLCPLLLPLLLPLIATAIVLTKKRCKQHHCGCGGGRWGGVGHYVVWGWGGAKAAQPMIQLGLGRRVQGPYLVVTFDHHRRWMRM